MSTYKEIKGFKVQTLASDTVASGITGGTWASGGDLNAPKGWGGRSGAGPQTAAQAAAGFTSPGGGIATVEHYDGSSWTETTDVNTARSAATHGGIQTSSIIAGGWLAPGNSNNVETWNGSSWTEVAEINTARRQLAMSTAGSNTASIAFAGYSTTYLGIAEEWDGSSWTEVADLNTPRSSLTATDQSSTAALAIAGYRGPPTADRTKLVEEWNGSSWTEIADINSERMDLGCGGSYTDCIIFAGTDGAVPFVGFTEHWDGSSWTEIADMATTRSEVGGTGSSTAGLAFGGTTPPYTNVTEEFTASSDFTKINLGQVYYNSGSNAFKVTQQSTPAGTWASGGNLNVAKNSAAGAGTQTAGMFIGGRGSPPSSTVYAQTEFYDGSSWTEVNDMNTGRYALSGANSGSQTATLVFGGYDTAILALTESWDGSSWTEVNDLNTAGSSGAGFGTQPAAIFTGGDNRSYNKTESWDGTSWTETTDLNTARAQMAGFGLATAGLICGGDLYPVTSPTRLSVQTELWNGSSWTEVNDLNTGRRRIGNGGFGTQTSGLTAGGYTTTYVANTESWNGTSWTEQTEIQTRDNTTGIGSGANSGLIAGGATSPGAASDATEEWTVPEENNTITVS